MSLVKFSLWSLAISLLSMGVAVRAAAPGSGPASKPATQAATKPAVRPIPMLAIPADWKATEQGDLADKFRQAAPLKIERLGTAVYGTDTPVDGAGHCLVPHPDGKSYDVLLWYRKEYMHNTMVYVVDLASGEVRRQEFPEWENTSRPEQGFTWWGVLGTDNKFYGANPDWARCYKNSGGGVAVSQYDHATHKITLYKLFKNLCGESTPLIVAPDGWIYGAGTWCGERNRHKVCGAYGFNPLTGQTRDLGPVGPGSKICAYAPTLGVCDTHLYVACGKTPWNLVAIDLKTGEQQVILKAPEGGDLMEISHSKFFGGAVAWIKNGIGAPKEYYWLYHGKAIRKEAQNGEMDDSCPWPKEMQDKKPNRRPSPEPELDMSQIYPDGDGRAIFRWKNADEDWREVTLENVKIYPLTLHRFINLDDGQLFGTAEGYKGRFLFNPATGKVTSFGAGGSSIYCLTTLAGKIYWSGYPEGPIFEFDPCTPWKDKNPHRVWDELKIFDLTRVKKMLSATTAADGRAYFGGKGQRDYEGGGLSWYEPATGKIGGMWEPFDNKPIGWVTTAHEPSDKDIRTPGRYVIIGAEGGEVFTYDTQKHELLKDVKCVPVAKAQYSGPLLEVAPGRMLGITWAGRGRKNGAVVYGISVPDGKVYFNKPIPWGIGFDWGQGIEPWGFATGSDGFIWATLTNTDGWKGGVLVRIDPRNANIEVIGSTDRLGAIAFIGRDAYLAGTTEIRCLRNVVPR